MATIDQSTLVNPVIAWPANQAFGIEAFELEVPVTVKGRVEIWRVPVSEAYPTGYFFSVNTGASYTTVEPGCDSWEKKLLATVQMTGVEDTSREGDSHMHSTNRPEFLEPGVVLDEARLNPNTKPITPEVIEEK